MINYLKERIEYLLDEHFNYLKERIEYLLDEHFNYPANDVTELGNFNKVYEFIEEVYELAYGDDAINKDYSEEEVLNKLKEYSENAYKYEQLREEFIK